MSGLVSGPACYEYKWLHEATITTCVKQKPEPRTGLGPACTNLMMLLRLRMMRILTLMIRSD